jgi:hypothetical protein
LIPAELAVGILRSVTEWHWNHVRPARRIALRYRYPLYPARDGAAPIIGTMHGPLPHLLYAYLAFLKGPTPLLIAGCTLSCLLYFGAYAGLTVHLDAMATSCATVQEPGLNGWTVYRVAPPAIRSASVSPP